MVAPSTPAPRSTRGWHRFVGGTALYVLAIAAASLAVRLTDPPTAARVALALAPAAALLWGMSGWLTAVRAFDELGRKVFAEAAAITLAVVLAATMTSGLLAAFAGVPQLDAFLVVALGGVTYSIATIAIWRRYR